MEARNRRKANAEAQLPQWNSKLSFSAQKPNGGAGKGAAAQGNIRKTPLGQPRRVPIGRNAAGDAKAAADGKLHTQATPAEPDKTPTICLFERFESLTIGTPAVSTAARGLSTSQPEPAGEAAKPRRNVAFGTPAVLTYTPAATPAAAPSQGTPLWSNAGHTPYSLEGPTAAAACIRECVDGDDAGSSSGVCMELFSSVITETALNETPAATRACPTTPAGAAGSAEAATPAVKPAADGTACLIRFAETPCNTADVNGIDLQTPASGSKTTARPASASFTGFGTASEDAGTSKEGQNTPPFFSRAAPGTAAGTSSAASSTPAAAAGEPLAVDGSLCTPAPTPKSKLKQPARVPVSTTRPNIPAELRQLLSNSTEDGIAVKQADKALMGSCDILSPVRSRKQQQHALGAEQQVLTPVRRSARKASKQQLITNTVHVQPMLEATNYCYQPNEALSDARHHG